MIAPVTGPGAAVVQEVKKTLPFSPISSVKVFSKRFQSVKVFSKYFLSVFKMFSKCQSVQNIFKVFQSVKGFKMFSKFGIPGSQPCSRELRKPDRRRRGRRDHDQLTSLYLKVYSAISKMVWRIFVACLCQKLALCKCFTSCGANFAPKGDLTWCDISWHQVIWLDVT